MYIDIHTHTHVNIYIYMYIYSIYTHTLCILGTAATGKSPEEDGHRSS